MLHIFWIYIPTQVCTTILWKDIFFFKYSLLQNYQLTLEFLSSAKLLNQLKITARETDVGLESEMILLRPWQIFFSSELKEILSFFLTSFIYFYWSVCVYIYTHTHFFFLFPLYLFIYLFLEANYFTILYWFCHTLTWIRHGCTCVHHPEPLSHLPPHPIPLGHPSAPVLSTLSHVSNLDWWSISHMVIYMFQCSSLKLSHLYLLPQSPKVCSLHVRLFCCLTYKVIVTIFLNSIYMH